MAWYKPAHLFRALRPSEVFLAQDVFHATLPPLNSIGITDGLGKGDNIWTVDRSFFDFLQSGPPQSLDQLNYLLNFGEAVRWDLATTAPLSPAVPGYPDRARDVFVHEMTHVWQFNRGDRVKLRSIYAQNIGAGYDFTVGDPWKTFNVEQQAHVVEVWNRDRKETNGEDHELFPYVHYIIRGEGAYRATQGELSSMDLAQLSLFWAGEKGFGIQDEEPIRTSAKDQSFLILLSGGVLFDVDRSILKPQAEALLQQAAVTIKANSGSGLKAVLINGHTDNTGDATYNMRLSEQRAKAVADWFVSRRHLSQSITRAQGFGKTQPVAPNTDPAGRAKNRRVEIYLMNN